MSAVVALVNKLMFRDEGQDLIEYGLLVVLIAIVAIAGAATLGNVVNTVFWQTIANAL
jgi:Flp pilus assembly pilin Flp